MAHLLLCFVQVDLLKREAGQMTGAQPSALRAIREKEREVVDAWTSLKSRVRGSCIQLYSYTMTIVKY